jgi:type VI secretion system protein ImpF
MSSNPDNRHQTPIADGHNTLQRLRDTSGISTRNRAQPSLLDRLTDDAPQQREEPHLRHLVSHGALRKAVLRDLCWLFNCVSAGSSFDLKPYPLVERSTLNFGMVALAGKHLSEIDWKVVEKSLTAAIVNFEPRILRDDLQVTCLSDNESPRRRNVLSIEIKGRFNHNPAPLPFIFRTDVDLENGHFDFEDIG